MRFSSGQQVVRLVWPILRVTSAGARASTALCPLVWDYFTPYEYDPARVAGRRHSYVPPARLVRVPAVR